MKAPAESTAALVRSFLSGPGAENERVEFKSKEKVETKDGRRELVRTLCAMANAQGGVVIVGLRRDGADAVVQDFPSDSELIRDLFHIAHDRTRPPLDNLLDARFEKWNGRSLLRIEVRRRVGRVLSFQNPDGSLRAYHRVGDTVREMTPEQIDASGRFEDQHGHQLHGLLVLDHVVLGKPRPLRPAPAGKTILRGSPHNMFNFGEAMYPDPFDRLTFVQLEADFQGGLDGISQTIQAAHKHLGLPLNEELFYSIKEGEWSWHGVSWAQLRDDLVGIEVVTQRMLGEDWRKKLSDHQGDLEYRPVILVHGRIPGGFLWVESQYRNPGHGFDRTKVGLVLGDIPFDDREIKAFFQAINANPGVYRQGTWTRQFTIRANVPLRGVSIITYPHRPDFPERLVATNPFFQRTETLRKASDGSIPDWALEAFCANEHLILYGQGGINRNAKKIRVTRSRHVPEGTFAQRLFCLRLLCRRLGCPTHEIGRNCCKISRRSVNCADLNEDHVKSDDIAPRRFDSRKPTVRASPSGGSCVSYDGTT